MEIMQQQINTTGKNAQAVLAGFQSRKASCLSKRDKSSAGRIDPKAVEICAAINARDEYYTTSSCSGRCFLYVGDGIKAHHHFVSTEHDNDDDNDDDNTDQHIINKDAINTIMKADVDVIDHNSYAIDNVPSGLGFFLRFRVCHDIIRNPTRYFNLHTLDSTKNDFDACGGGDPVRSIGQYDYLNGDGAIDGDVDDNRQSTSVRKITGTESLSGPLWLRFEPFILHVMCRSLSAASALMTAARPAFKNVGLTSFKQGSGGKYIIAIWGDEGIDMPLTTPDSVTKFVFTGREEWLSQLVNERHLRNWQKIDRFVHAVRSMPMVVDEFSSDDWVYRNNEFEDCCSNNDEREEDKEAVSVPKKFDVVGDVALLHALPDDCTTEKEKEAIGNIILSRNKAIKVVAVRSSTLIGSERAPGIEGLEIIAGVKRSPLITSHAEFGIKCVVDLNQTFFSTRMAAERLRICQQVARGEKVLALFCGVGMDAMQIVARTEATVIAVELNPVAINCAERGKQLLVRNKAVKCHGAADRLTFLQGDAIEIMKQLDKDSFERCIAPRPKESNLDGDLGNGDGGVQFLEYILPLLKNQAECHWYDFAADHELPNCLRTRNTIQKVCDKLGYTMDVLHVAKVGSIAKRQLRICMDFRVLK